MNLLKSASKIVIHGFRVVGDKAACLILIVSLFKAPLANSFIRAFIRDSLCLSVWGGVLYLRKMMFYSVLADRLLPISVSCHRE